MLLLVVMLLELSVACDGKGGRNLIFASFASSLLFRGLALLSLWLPLAAYV